MKWQQASSGACWCSRVSYAVNLQCPLKIPAESQGNKKKKKKRTTGKQALHVTHTTPDCYLMSGKAANKTTKRLSFPIHASHEECVL